MAINHQRCVLSYATAHGNDSFETSFKRCAASRRIELKWADAIEGRDFDRLESVCDRFGIQMGRMHVTPVGPHPTGSCQMTVPPEKFAEVTAWLALNRDGLTVFTHAETGDVMADHTQHVVWLDDSQPLRLDVLRAAIHKT